MMNLQKITVFIVSVVVFGTMNLCALHLGPEDEIEFLIERLSILEQQQNALTRRVEELVQERELVALQNEHL